MLAVILIDTFPTQHSMLIAGALKAEILELLIAMLWLPGAEVGIFGELVTHIKASKY